MPEENTQGAPEATDETPPEGDNGNQETPVDNGDANGNANGDDAKPEEPTEAKPPEGKGDDVKKLKTEAQTLRGKLRSAETERDTHKAEADGLRAQVLSYRVKEAVTAQAQKLGVRDAQSAQLVADLAIAQGGRLKLNGDKVDGLDDVLKSIKEKHAFLFFDSPGSADGAKQGDAPSDNGNDWLRRQMGGN